MRKPSSRPAAPAVVWRDGVHIADTVLWCDARRARDLCFLSRPAAPRGGAHGKLLASARMVRLLEGLGPPARGEVLPAEFSRPFSLGAARIELFPSGLLPGGAQLRVEIGRRVVIYAGTPSPRRGLGEPMALRDGEVLVIEAPLAAQTRGVPTVEAAAAALRDEVLQALAAGATPLLLASSLVAAPCAIALLAGRWPLACHPRVARVVAAYRRADCALPELRTLSPSMRPAPGEVLVWPLELRDSPWLARLAPLRRLAMVGVGADAAALGADAAVALPIGLDRAGLIEYVARTGAREVLLTAGFCDEVVRGLTAVGVRRVAPLGPPRQMQLFA